MSAMQPQIKLLLVETLRDPQGAARRLIALNPPMEARVIGLLLVAVVTVLIARLSLVISPAEELAAFLDLLSDPFLGVPLQAAMMMGFALAMTLGGRVGGGTGHYVDALLLVVWMEFVLTIMQVVQMVAFLVFPPLGFLAAFVSVGLFFVLLTNFAAALHGFTNLVKVLFGMLASLFALSLALALILAIFGFTPPTLAV
ncbi:MAG: YIP1 family protein [Paracoccaceae bacterium]